MPPCHSGHIDAVRFLAGAAPQSVQAVNARGKSPEYYLMHAPGNKREIRRILKSDAVGLIQSPVDPAVGSSGHIMRAVGLEDEEAEEREKAAAANRVPYSEEEGAALERGMEQHGQGNWKAIVDLEGEEAGDSWVVLPLKCVITHQPLSDPARCFGCEHLSKCNHAALAGYKPPSASKVCPVAGCNKPFRVRGIVRDAALQALLTPYVVTAAELDPARQEVEVRVCDGKMAEVRWASQRSGPCKRPRQADAAVKPEVL